MRMTRKCSAALALAHRLKLIGNNVDRELIYQQLEELGWHWNSETGVWEQWADEPAE